MTGNDSRMIERDPAAAKKAIISRLRQSNWAAAVSPPCAQTLSSFTMADDLLLFYLIEGTSQPSYISVSNGKPMKVDDLRKTIFEDDCKHLAANHKNLVLLKVSILLLILLYLPSH